MKEFNLLNKTKAITHKSSFGRKGGGRRGGRTTSLGILIALCEGRRTPRGNRPLGSWDAQQTPCLCQESYWPKMKGDSPLSTSLWSASLFCKVVSNRFRTPGGRLQLEKFSKKFLCLLKMTVNHVLKYTFHTFSQTLTAPFSLLVSASFMCGHSSTSGAGYLFPEQLPRGWVIQ